MRVSVVIPVLDGEAFLAQAIRSVRDQSLPPHEIIVADNGSTDRSLRIAEAFGPPVRVMSVKRRGAAAARAAAASQTSGDALMFLDADDLMGPDTLAHLADALDGRDGAMACCPWRRYERVGACWRARPPSCAPRRPGQDDLAAWLTGWYHPPCSMLWSRAAYEAAGGWDPDVRINQDGDLVMRALAAGVPLIRARGGLGYYRRLPDGGISLSGKGRTPRGLEGRIDVLEKLERRLRGTGRLERHAAPLAEAFGEVARDAARTGAAEAGARARQGIARTGGAAWFGTARRAVGRRIGAMMPQDRPAGIVRRGVPRPAPGPVAAGEDPLVSVILPTYNRRVTLRRAIDSVLAQTWRNLELIVVDDGSEDGTDDLVRSVRDSRLRVLRQACNEGVATARNRGLAEAKGGLIAFLDSDDEWRPEKLERQVARMRAAPSRVGLLYTGLLVRQPGGVVETWTPEARGMVLAEILRRNVVHFGTSSVMIRAEAAEAVGGFDPTLPANEDHDYWARIARLYEFDFDPEPLAIYDQAGGEPSAEGKRSARFGRNMQARDRFVQEHGFEADRLGATFAYQMDSARRHLEWDEGSARTGRRLLLKAARAAPGRRLPWVWMALSALPKRSRALAVSRLRGVRRRPEPRRHRRAAPHDT